MLQFETGAARDIYGGYAQFSECPGKSLDGIIHEDVGGFTASSLGLLFEGEEDFLMTNADIIKRTL
jgi:hypothetical protein